MKKLFLPLLLLASFTLPTAVNAETVWLILAYGNSGVEKIEMKDLDHCIENEEAFKKGLKSPLARRYVCIKGK